MRKATLSRREMLDRLLVVFRNHGYDAASLSDLMAALNLQKGGLYHHFPGGKEQMARDVLGHIDQIFAQMVFDPLSSANNPAAAVAAMCDALDRYFVGGSLACLPALIGLGSSRDLFAHGIQHFFTRWITALTNLLIRTGCPAEPAAQRAEQVVADLQGAIVLSRAMGSERPFYNALHRTRHMLGGEDYCI